MNKGIKFENDFVRTITNDSCARFGLENAIGAPSGFLGKCDVDFVGKRRVRRPLLRTADGAFVCDCMGSTIGDDVADVIVTDRLGKKHNVSLKYGPRVTFCNTGIARFIPKDSFETYKSDTSVCKTYMPGTDGAKLLEMLGIDKERFADVFVNYRRGARRQSMSEIVSVYTDGDKNKISTLYRFVESVIGYGYVLVHNINGITHYVNLDSAEKTRQFIGAFNSASVKYPLNGSAKRVELNIDFENIHISLVFRSKERGCVYPTHICSDYTIKHKN